MSTGIIKKNSEGTIPLLAWILVVFTLADVISAYFLTAANPRWQTYIYILSSIIASVMIASVVFCVIKGDYIRAGIVATTEQAFRGLVAAFIYRDLGIPMQILTIVLSAIIVLEWLPKSYIVKILPMILTSSLVMLAFDILEPSWRIEGALPPGYRFLIVGFIILIFTIYAVVNFKTYPLMVKLVLILLGLTSGTVITVSATANSIASKLAIEDAYFLLESTAQGLGNTIDAFLSFTLENLMVDVNAPEFTEYLNGPQEMKTEDDLVNSIIQILNDYTRRDPIFIESYALLDHSGKVLIDTISKDIGNDQSKDSFFSIPYESGLAYISPIASFQENSHSVIYFSAPVINPNNEIVGVLRIRYNAKILQSIIVKSNNKIGVQSLGILLNEQGIILAHGFDSQRIQTRIDNITLQDAVQNKEDSVVFTEVNLPVSGYTIEGYGSVVSLENAPWKVAYFQQRQNFLGSIDSQTNFLVLIVEGIAVIVVIIGLIGAQSMTSPLLSLTNTARSLAAGDLLARSEISSDDEFGLLARTLNTMSNQIYATRSSLEKRIKDRTQAIETAAQVSRVLSLTLDTELLVKQVVDELQKAFKFYHVQIYLLDTQEKMLVLAGGTGEVGDILLQQGHSITLGRGLVGRAAITRGTILVDNTARDPNWLTNPLLPETRSEVAIPIILRGELLGVLDVQQNSINAFVKQDQDLLELIAGQVAISLANAHQYEHTKEQVALQERIGQIIDKVTATTSVQEAIQVTLKELSLHTGTKKSAAKWII